jgi:hypothetical protein
VERHTTVAQEVIITVDSQEWWLVDNDMGVSYYLSICFDGSASRKSEVDGSSTEGDPTISRLSIAKNHSGSIHGSFLCIKSPHVARRSEYWLHFLICSTYRS